MVIPFKFEGLHPNFMPTKFKSIAIGRGMSELVPGEHIEMMMVVILMTLNDNGN